MLRSKNHLIALNFPAFERIQKIHPQNVGVAKAFRHNGMMVRQFQTTYAEFFNMGALGSRLSICSVENNRKTGFINVKMAKWPYTG